MLSVIFKHKGVSQGSNVTGSKRERWRGARGVKVTFREARDDCENDRPLRTPNDQNDIQFLAFLWSFHSLFHLFWTYRWSVMPIVTDGNIYSIASLSNFSFSTDQISLLRAKTQWPRSFQCRGQPIYKISDTSHTNILFLFWIIHKHLLKNTLINNINIVFLIILNKYICLH